MSEVTLTKDEAECLANHLEIYIIKEVRDDIDYDSIDYLCALCGIYKRCREAAENGN